MSDSPQCESPPRPIRFSFLILWWGILALIGPGLIDTSANAQSQVRLERHGAGFRIVRNGEPFPIKGVGGATELKQLAAAGGNSIRTWGTNNLGNILDMAHEHGLTVCAGLWLGHKRHGFDYHDQDAVLQQMNRSLAVVQQFKDHPALLLWGLGNEMEGDGSDPVIWHAVNHLAREVKQIDGDHPVMTVIAELGPNASKIRSIEQFCPDVDIIGINSYGGIRSIGKRFKTAKSSKPYIITEHGPLGPWEAHRTSWGAPVEASSTKKGSFYVRGYHANATQEPNLCLGAYSFLWGHKQETTATWFGMLLPDGSRLEAADAMKEAWTGTPPKNRCPRIASLKLNKTIDIVGGDSVRASLSATDPENDPMTYRWFLRSESGTVGDGGDPQAKEQTIENAINGTGDTTIVTFPKSGGRFRLFAYVHDNHGGAAVANLPIEVKTSSRRF